MATINAVDGASCSVDGVPYPIPVGTTLNLKLGNDQNLVISGTQQNGDGSNTPIFSKISAAIEGMVFSITDTATEDSFLELFTKSDHQIVVSNGGIDYSIEKGILISPSTDGTPAIESNTRKTEAFTIKSQSGKIRRS